MTAHRTIAKTAVALAVALSVLAPAPASARVALNGSTSASGPAHQSGTEVVRASHGGFDWGDAGVGAVGGVGLSMLAFGSALVAAQRRERRPGRSAATTG
jgi:hypothetical protein